LTKKPVYSEAAAYDLVDLLQYAARDKPQAAMRLIEQLEAKCLLIASTPEIGERQPRLGEGVRSSTVGRYVIFHRCISNQVEILRVIPGDRNIMEI
jgi:toxin ParE1/3/4